jgi:hypothetical protein
MNRATGQDMSGEILLGIFRAVYGDLQVFRSPWYTNGDNDYDDDQDDDYMSREEYRMLNQAIANSIETMPEFDFTSRNNEIVLDVASRTVADDADLTKTCWVCLENYVSGGTVMDLPCQHSFHTECIYSWAVQVPKCPVCRQDIPIK